MIRKKPCGPSRSDEGQVFLSEEARAALDTFTKLEEQYNDICVSAPKGNDKSTL